MLNELLGLCVRCDGLVFYPKYVFCVDADQYEAVIEDE